VHGNAPVADDGGPAEQRDGPSASASVAGAAIANEEFRYIACAGNATGRDRGGDAFDGVDAASAVHAGAADAVDAGEGAAGGAGVCGRYLRLA
jgi:hypothetical protein